MATVQTAVNHLESIFLDEFKSACQDRLTRPNIILDIHRYFKYQTRVYTFSNTAHLKSVYNDLRQCKISDTQEVSSEDISYPLMFLTQVSHRLLMALNDDELEIETSDPLEDIVEELSNLFCLHAQPQEYIEDSYYTATFSVNEWTKILQHNPWLLVGALIRYTSNELTQNLYLALAEAAELLKELGVET